MVLAAMTLPVEIIAVTKEQEFRNVMFFITCSFPFGIQEKLLFVNLEKEDSSILMRASNLSIIFHTFI